MSYKNTWEQDGLYRIFTGDISGKEVLNANLESHGDSRFIDIKYVISDFTPISEFTISENDIKTIAVIDDVAARSNAKLKIAVVVTLERLKDWVHLYIVKMQDSTYECEIFNNIDDARKWVS